MKKIVAKFGGSSLADASQIKKAKDIICARDERNYIVVSAAGKRNQDDDKITDLLISVFEKRNDEKEAKKTFDIVAKRYIDIVKELNLNYDIVSELNSIYETSKKKSTRDYLASRGEYLLAKIMAKYLDRPFLDMQNVIIFDEDKKVNYDLTYKNIKEKIDEIEKEYISNHDGKSFKVVIPGFYGSNRDGEIVTFSRGGSDITGSIVARAMNADVYENWTDVSGVMFADPRIAKDPKPIEYITYAELRELSYMGASVLHEETVYPVSKTGIPIYILNTNSPRDEGTKIVSSIPAIVKRKEITGIAGKTGFSAILLQKALMNEEIGYLAKLLRIFEEERISVEHCPTGIDTISIILKTDEYKAKKDIVLKKIADTLSPDVLTVEDNIALLAVVGEGMIYHKDIIVKIFKTLADANISIKMIDQGSSGINMIIGIEDADYEAAIRALSTI